jgi:hypothetical protein
MTDLLQMAKDRPVLSIGGAVTIVGACISAALWTWGEFAHAGDVRKEVESIRQETAASQASTVREIQINRIGGEVAIIDLQARDTRNRLRELSAKQKLSSGEVQNAKELGDELSELQQQKRAKERLLDQIKAGVPIR